jgi:hypothetical protein
MKGPNPTMRDESLPHLVDKTPAELCQGLDLGDVARGLLSEDLSLRQYLGQLVAQEEFPDAARFWSRALPKREAVWWACLCARSAMAEGTPRPQLAALEAAEAWCADPSEENRRNAMAASEAAELGTPGGCAAAAAFWSGGSLAPPDLPVVPPADDLTAHGVAGSVMLAAVRSEPEKAPEKYKRFFEQGVAVAEGKARWREAAVVAPEAKPEPTSPGRTAAATRPVINWD